MMKELVQQLPRYIDGVDDYMGMARNLGALNDPERNNEEAEGVVMTASPNVPGGRSPGTTSYQTFMFELSGREPGILMGDHLRSGPSEPHLKVYNGDRINGDRIAIEYTNRSTGIDVASEMIFGGKAPFEYADEGKSVHSHMASGILYGSNAGLEQISNVHGIFGNNFEVQPADARSGLRFDTHLDGHIGDKTFDRKEGARNPQEGLDLEGNRSRRALAPIVAVNTQAYRDKLDGDLVEDQYDSTCYKFKINDDGTAEAWRVDELTGEDLLEIQIDTTADRPIP
jgi:hypothetical protein